MGSSLRRRGAIALAVTSLCLGAIVAVAAPASAIETSDKNHPDYWSGIGYGTCVKYESPGTPFHLGSAPAGTIWSILVVKAGSSSSTYDPHAEYAKPVPGAYYHPSGKSISHVIVCRKNGTNPTTTTTTVNPEDCGGYTPSALEVDKASVEPGETFTLSGTAGPNDLLSFTLSSPTTSPTVLGTATTGPDGSFAVVLLMPDALPAGNYTVTVRSEACARSATVIIATQSVNRSGCGEGNPLTLVRGAANTWTVIPGTPPFNTARTITIRLNQRAPSPAQYTLYAGAWPASGTVTLAVPAGAPLDRYFLVQSGSQKGSNKPRTESCPLRVVDPPPPPADTSSAATTQSVVGALWGAALLVTLRRRRRPHARV